MSSKKDMGLMEIFTLLGKNKITPNQFYLMYCLREAVQSVNINNHLEIRSLVSDGWVIDKNGPYLISDKGVTLINEVESYFKVQKKKTSISLMGADFVEKVNTYNELFPKRKLPSGKLARASFRNLEVNFKWFFENYEYSWDTILKATAAYVDEYETKNFNFMRTSKYFIKKQEQDKTITSDLADYCAMIESGGEIEPPNYFKDKVV